MKKRKFLSGQGSLTAWKYKEMESLIRVYGSGAALRKVAIYCLLNLTALQSLKAFLKTRVLFWLRLQVIGSQFDWKS